MAEPAHIPAPPTDDTSTLAATKSTSHTTHVETQIDPNAQANFYGKPTGWSAMSKVVRDFDEEKVKECKEDIDTLLVFVSRTQHSNLASTNCVL